MLERSIHLDLVHRIEFTRNLFSPVNSVLSEDGIEWSDVDDAFPSDGDQTTYNEIDASSKLLLIRIGLAE